MKLLAVNLWSTRLGGIWSVLRIVLKTDLIKEDRHNKEAMLVDWLAITLSHMLYVGDLGHFGPKHIENSINPPS